MSLQYLCALFVLTPLVSAHLGGQLLGSDIPPKVYCGRALSGMIADICEKVANNGDLEKRSGGAAMFGGIAPPFYKEPNHLGWPWMSSKSAALGSVRGKRFMGGVADECCDKPCSINELLSYCFF